MSELRSLLTADIATVTQAISALEMSPVELAQTCLERAHSVGERFNVFTQVLDDRALSMARAAEQRALAGSRLGNLDGIPVTVKDLISLKGILTTNGAAGNWQDARAVASSPSVSNLERAGAVIVGKTNLHELAMGITSVNPHFGAVKNPWDPKRSAGGSSGGSAAALALGIGFGSVGTDTGGSIRIPAAHCGIFGLKPGYRVISTEGVSPISWSLDHVGPMAACANDLRNMYYGMLGITAKNEHPCHAIDFRRLTIGVPRTYFTEAIEPGVLNAYRATLDALDKAGARLIDVELPAMTDVVATAFALSKAEAGSVFDQQFKLYSEQLGEDVRSFFESARDLTAIAYAGALQKQRRFRHALCSILGGVSAIAVPATPACAQPLNMKEVVLDEVREPMFDCMIRYTSPFNVSGHPVAIVPTVQATEGLPVGIQFVGSFGSEEFLLELTIAYQEIALADHFANVERLRIRDGN